MGALELSHEQKAAVKHIQDWLDRPGDASAMVLGGFAGVGKSVIVGHLFKELSASWSPQVAAFTGKAVDVLRRKGIAEARTLHSLLYRVWPDKDGRLVFRAVEKLDGGMVIVDEASMVPEEIYDLLMGHKVPVLFVGDHFQLPPVGPSTFNVMRMPDVRLETIHRQAANSGIIRMSMDVREGRPLDWWSYAPQVRRVLGEEALAGLGDYDAVICATNKVRYRINNTVRKAQGKPLHTPVAGDRVLCKQNDKRAGIFNGQMFDLTGLHVMNRAAGWLELALQDELDPKPEPLKVMAPYVGFYEVSPGQREVHQGNGRHPIVFHYGYCLTAHSAQGSEFDRVLVVDDSKRMMSMGTEDRNRWLYTALTRAKTELHVTDVLDIEPALVEEIM